LRISHLSAECSPFAKTGGLGDVVGALPKALARRGHDVDIWIPFHLEAAQWYRRRLQWPIEATPPFDVSILGRPYRVGILKGHLPHNDVPVYFVAHDPLFHRPGGLYAPNDSGMDDGLWRFTIFVRAALEAMRRLGRSPQVLHTHDWHPALATMLGAWSGWRNRWFDDVSSVLTIHNIQYQGAYPGHLFTTLGLPDDVRRGGLLDFRGSLNFLKGGIEAADVITTVSPTFAAEIQTPAGGAGLDAVLRGRNHRLTGILNGIDRQVWNPAADPHISARYSVDEPSGKSECRHELLRTAGFEPGDPGMVLGAIGRLVDQKGFDLLLEVAPELIRRGLRIVMLGSGEPALEGAMRLLESHYHGQFRAFLGYDEALSHRIEAGVDALVMPSRFEPCGLTQMYSLAYGTVPIVRKTGGLADSVITYDGYNENIATGFHFDDPSPHALAAEILRAQHIFFQRGTWYRLMRNGMSVDNSWEHAAGLYEGVYQRAREVRGLAW
jgi:starch synthase